MAKGSSWEREISTILSLWWSQGKRDDIFWRTSGSGARAKTRSKTKQTTFGQYGDIQATDPIGQPLMDLCTIELKRGYTKSTFADLIETSTHASPKPCAYEKFIQQARTDAKNAGVLTWILIVKRDRREALVLIPYHFYLTLKDYGVKFQPPIMKIKYKHTSIKGEKTKTHILIKGHIFGTTLSNFLRAVDRKIIEAISS